MKRKIAITFLAFLLSSCGIDNTTSQADSKESIDTSENKSEISSEENSSFSEDSSMNSENESSQINPEDTIDVNIGKESPVHVDGYNWSINENQAFSKNLGFSVSSSKRNDNIKTYLDGKLLEPFDENLEAKLAYDLDPEHPCRVDSVEHCQDRIELNGNYVGILHNDRSISVDFNLNDFKEGDNVVRLYIGFVYTYEYYKVTNVTYKQGAGDDFRIANVAISFSNGITLEPSKIVGYYVNSTFTDLVPKEMNQVKDEYYWIGDGWGSDTTYIANINHKDPNYVRPVVVDYHFNYTPFATNKNYNVDTTNFESGKHTLTTFVDGIKVKQNNFIIDNEKPDININIENDSIITPNFKFNVLTSDDESGIKNKTIKLDGNVISDDSFVGEKLTNGNHNISVIATDNANNTNAISKTFNISDNACSIVISEVSGKQVVDKQYEATYAFKEYNASSLNVNLNKNNNIDEFEISVNDNSKVFVDYDGSTNNGEKIIFEALNNLTNKKDILYVGTNGNTKFAFDPTNYVKDNKVKVYVSLSKVGNGSDKILWVSDTQYLAKVESNYSDISSYYNVLMEYVSNQYKNNNISYMLHTGDIVDDNPEYTDKAIAEWKKADTAFKIIDQDNVPYGVCAGNHDVGSSVEKLDYSYYQSYFGLNRTGSNLYYGGSLNNNECHYDLITIGNYDFIILYLGYGKEANDETIAFANYVLKKYSHRNAIIATHAYLDNGGTLDPNARGQAIYDNIVLPNGNVKLVLCGHTDGSEVVKKVIGNRTVFELLNCYQFVETKTDDKPISETNHVTSGLKCNGEGFIKSLEFVDGKLIAKTFSPVINVNTLNSKNGINYALNDYTIKLDLIEKDDSFNSNYLKAYQLNDNIKNLSAASGKYTMTSGNFIYVSDETGAYGFNVIEN